MISHASPPNGPGARPPDAESRLLRIHNTLSRWYERSQQRRELLGMPEHLLKDLGITQADADHEYRKPFWKP